MSPCGSLPGDLMSVKQQNRAVERKTRIQTMLELSCCKESIDLTAIAPIIIIKLKVKYSCYQPNS